MSDNLAERLFRITNYYDHPTDSNYMVVHYFRKEQSDSFRELLEENNIPYEFDVDTEKKTIYMFGIKKTYEKEAIRLNFIAIGKHREKFINEPFLRWLIIGFFFLLIVIALIGVFMANK